MTNAQVIDLWKNVLAEKCHCFPEKNGEYPCDNNKSCDGRCLEKEISETFLARLKKAN